MLRDLTRHFNLRDMKENLATAKAPTPAFTSDPFADTYVAMGGVKY